MKVDLKKLENPYVSRTQTKQLMKSTPANIVPSRLKLESPSVKAAGQVIKTELLTKFLKLIESFLVKFLRKNVLKLFEINSRGAPSKLI